MSFAVSQISIYVEDQAAAVEFWTLKMGCTLTRDMPYGEARWIEVEPPGGGARLGIFRAGPGLPGLRRDHPNYVLFEADDITKTYEELSARGVEFIQPPVEEPWGWSATFKDNEGHLFHLGRRG